MPARRVSIPSILISLWLLLLILPSPVVQSSSAQQAANRYASSPLGIEVDLPAGWVANEYSNVGFGFSFMSPEQQFDENGDLLKGARITLEVIEPGTDPRTLIPSEARAEGHAVTVGKQDGLRYPARGGAKDAQTVVDVYRDDLLYRFALHYNGSDTHRSSYDDAFASILTSLSFTAREGFLPVKSIDLPASAYAALSFPFQGGSDWMIAGGGGYNNRADHGGCDGCAYAKYALDFIRSDGRSDVLALAPTSGVLSHKETTASECIDVSIAGINATQDLYLQMCHINYDSYLGDGSVLSKGQRLGYLSLDGCGGKCTLPHIHIAAFTGVRGNPWTAPGSMVAVPFDTVHTLALDGQAFPPDGSYNQWGNSCCYRSSLSAPGPVLGADIVVRDPKDGQPINTKPLHPQRTLYVQVLNGSGQVVYSGQSTAQYQANGDHFRGAVILPQNWVSGIYLVKVQLEHTLRAQVPGIPTITNGGYLALPSMSLRAGDIDGDNQLSILDYNIIYDCYSDLLPARNCTDPNKKLAADITDDGKVNGFDYNLWIRIVSTLSGE